MKNNLSLPGETTLADTAVSKSESFYKLTGSELKQFYKSRMLDAPLYVLLIVKTHGKAGWKWTFKVKDFCKEWGISKSAFYRAVSKLKSLDMLHWEVGEVITVWYGTDIAKSASLTEKSILSRENSPYSGTGSPCSGTGSPYSGTGSPCSGNIVPIVGLETPRTLTSPSVVETSDFSQSYSKFLKTLSDKQRENFLDFGKKKANLLPKPPELPLKWIEANWQELRSQWEQTLVGSTAITSLTDWTQHPDWATWLEEMRAGVPRFVALGTCFDNKTRRAIADWADERGLIWGEES